MDHSRIPALVVAAVLLGPGSLPAGEAPAPSPYQRVTLATTYQVDPEWPKRPPSAAWADMPGIAVDAMDTVWAFTRAVPPVQAYSAQGEYLRGFGESFIKKAHHIRVGPDGNLWLADVGNHAVFQVSPEGKLLRTLGTSGTAGVDQSHFNQPTDMAISPSGDVFVSDGYGNGRVVRYDRDGRFVRSWGRVGVAPGEFSIPHSIALDSRGRLYVADRNNVRVQVFDGEGKLLDVWKDLVVPWGIWITPADEVWVCGSSPMSWRKEDGALGCPPKDQVFMKFNGEGKLLQLWTVPKGEDGKERPGDLNWLHCMALDSKGNIYAGDIKGKRAQKFLKIEPARR